MSEGLHGGQNPEGGFDIGRGAEVGHTLEDIDRVLEELGPQYGHDPYADQLPYPDLGGDDEPIDFCLGDGDLKPQDRPDGMQV